MHLNEEEFNEKWTGALDAAVCAMAESPEIDPEKFFSMVCILENLQYFSPVIFSALKKNVQE
ncbi:hypothetical protein [Adhaeribacter soli]|uniref:PH domain-containing protein n=1 Tax=Adhaeribacter soli TaxID=2607655 RepID=A0A5N1ILW8_9BACT|nr:hypothetical protein [Adhaeribacter soli]KAA9325644.1 hypothetical protein F0P94_17055 [Adhaeribacter soli]